MPAVSRRGDTDRSRAEIVVEQPSHERNVEYSGKCTEGGEEEKNPAQGSGKSP